ncbi:MAG: serine/threonine protein kinase [Oligoflexia bacterium]|nr:serine/threonine protein kinase [Oligoflexia bacterium]
MYAKIINNKYQLIDLLGKGGVGDVWSAERLTFDDIVAVKKIKATDTSDLEFKKKVVEREAKLTAKLHHENICKIFDIQIVPETMELFIVMEYINGIDLKSLLDIVRTHKLIIDINVALSVCVEVLSTLKHVHNFSKDKTILHGDVSCPNIMVTNAGTIKLIDFGIARDFARGEAVSNQSTTSVWTSSFFNPYYSSPDLFEWDQKDGKCRYRGERYGQQHDVFSLGIILYEMLTLKNIGGGVAGSHKPLEFWKENYQSPKIINPNVPSELSNLVDRWLSLDSSNQHYYQKCDNLLGDIKSLKVFTGYRKDEVAKEIQRIVDKGNSSLGASGVTVTNNVRPVVTGQKTTRLRMMMVVAVLALIVALLVGMLWHLRSSKQVAHSSFGVYFKHKHTIKLQEMPIDPHSNLAEMNPERLHFAACGWLCVEIEKSVSSVLDNISPTEDAINLLTAVLSDPAKLDLQNHCGYVTYCSRLFHFTNLLSTHVKNSKIHTVNDFTLIYDDKTIGEEWKKAKSVDQINLSNHGQMDEFRKTFGKSSELFFSIGAHDSFSYLNLEQKTGIKINLQNPVLFDSNEKCRKLGDIVYAFALLKHFTHMKKKDHNYQHVFVPFDSQLRIGGVHEKKILVEVDDPNSADDIEKYGVCYYQRVDGLLKSGVDWRPDLKQIFK